LPKHSQLLPKQRGNVKIENLTTLNALVYICGNGRSWVGAARKVRQAAHHLRAVQPPDKKRLSAAKKIEQKS
jgi:hypothetical protein